MTGPPPVGPSSAGGGLVPHLYEYALGKRIIIATPTVLIPMLRTIALSWDEKAVRDTTEKIQKLGRGIYERLTTVGGPLAALGGSLDKSLDRYNETIGSLERSVPPAARRFPIPGSPPPRSCRNWTRWSP